MEGTRWALGQGKGRQTNASNDKQFYKCSSFFLERIRIYLISKRHGRVRQVNILKPPRSCQILQGCHEFGHLIKACGASFYPITKLVKNCDCQ